MSLGFVMMAHGRLDRAAQVALHLADEGCPVVIHVDRRTPKAAFFALVERVKSNRNIHLAPRVACDWGAWSLVEASRHAVRYLLDHVPSVRHVYLISGTCLPLKPVGQLRDYLDQHPDTDFIESVTIAEVPWIKDGLGEERFTMSFPFAWKRQKRFFDLWVDLQRRLGRKRAVPDGLRPHMGSQWWCLTRTTLERILSDPDAHRIDRYFRRVWIPDESYYATMVRRHTRQIESRSLTLSKFDFQGKPHVFYDDHLPLLRQSSAFFARKIWPGSRRLYGAFLGAMGQAAPKQAQPAMPAIDRVFAEAIQRRTRGRPGLLMAGRYPDEGFENSLSAGPYSVFHGFGDLYEGFAEWAEAAIGGDAHGHLFARKGAEFARGQVAFPGCLTTSPELRDYNPEMFLTNLLWNSRGSRQSFLFGPRDRQDIAPLLARDPNASIFAISGAWALPLLRQGRPVAEIRSKAALLQRREALHIDRLAERRTRARVRIWTLAEVLDDPMAPIWAVTDDLAGTHGPLPALKTVTGLTDFLQELRNVGMNPHTAGAFGELGAQHDPEPAALRSGEN